MNKESDLDVEFLEAIEGIDDEVESQAVVKVEPKIERVVSDEGTTLSIIQQEILSLRKKQLQGIELTYAEAKKLETLYKIKSSIVEIGVPEPTYDYSQVSDKEILDVLKQGKKKKKK